jgi:hypothetical protein
MEEGEYVSGGGMKECHAPVLEYKGNANLSYKTSL